MSAVLAGLSAPVVAAPMAGGLSTPELVAAVAEAGGLGFLAGGYRPVRELADEIVNTRALTYRPYGVNLLVPPEGVVGPVEFDGNAGGPPVAEYRQRLAGVASERGVTLGWPAGGDDSYPGKIGLIAAYRPAVVSFAFGLPEEDDVAALHSAGSEVWITVTNPETALEAAALGADALVVQGTEAGGHRGGADDTDDYPTLPLLRLVAARVTTPLVAAGGITDGAALAAVLAAGATAAQLGTAFLRCPEAGTPAGYREALAAPAETRLTRAFTGRRARAIANDFVRDHDAAAPVGYPEVYQVTAPLLAAARAAGDAAVANYWAGQTHELARDEPAAEVVVRVTGEAEVALAALVERARHWR